MSIATQNKRPGRPVRDESGEVRGRLLDATRELCVEVGLDAASTKAIAARAGVNPAMIHYYFGSKEALSLAMMREVMAPVLDQLDLLATQGAASMTLDGFMRGYMRALAANRWLPQLVVREVLPANGRFRDLFLSELGSRAVRLVPRLLKQERDAGRVSRDLDLQRVMISVVSVAVFPFVAAPIIEPAIGISLADDTFVDGLIDHSIALLRNGLKPGAAA